MAAGGGAAGRGEAARIEELHDQLRLSEKLMADAQMGWEEKLEQAEKLAAQRQGKLASLEGEMEAMRRALDESEKVCIPSRKSLS